MKTLQPTRYLGRPIMLSPGGVLRKTIEEGTIQAPGAPFALAAKLIESWGFHAAYLSGAAFSAGELAVPDVGLFTLTELAEHTRRVANSVHIPLIVDADTGFGAAVNVERTIQELEHAGAAAIQLEDQQLPKRCGHLSGKTIVPVEEMCAKLRAAGAARRDENLVIIARTDTRATDGLAAAVERSQRYLEAGADWIFPEALASYQEFEQFAQSIDAPLVANMTEFGKSPLLTAEELSDLGYAVILYPVTLLRVAMKAMEGALALLAETGSQHEFLEIMQTRQELYELIDYQGFEERDRAHFGGHDVDANVNADKP